MRWLVLALIVLNAGLYVWNAGWLPTPTTPRVEPRPQDRQINPDALRLLPEAAQARPPAPAGSPADAAAPAAN